MSNEPQNLRSLPENECSDYFLNLNFDDKLNDRVLGMCWNVVKDQIIFKISLPNTSFTRRGILSGVSSLYDPLGFICPVILQLNFCSNLSKQA